MADYFSGPKSTTDTSANTIELNLKEIQLNRIKIWQKDEWKGTNILVSLNKLNCNADTFDLTRNIISANTVSIDHPLFSQYDYDGNEPEDTTTSVSTAEENKVN